MGTSVGQESGRRTTDATEGAGDYQNTPSVPIVDLAAVTERPAQLIGMHFFNPVPVQQLVELIPALTTSQETVRRTRDFAGRLGKQAIPLGRSAAGRRALESPDPWGPCPLLRGTERNNHTVW